MRPHATALLSSAVQRTSRTPIVNPAIKSFFTTTPRRTKLVRPQAATATPDHQIPIPTPSHPVTMSTPINSQSVLDLIKVRRSYYPLSKDLTISKARIAEIVKESTLHVPTSFNAQSTRVVVLFDGEHEKLWDITSEILKPIVPADQWQGTADKLSLFKGAAGSVLFFEDIEVVQGQQKAFATYADKFPIWATQSDAILQYVIWVALEAEGLGANLQHYNPLIDDRVAAEWKIPSNWKLNAQLNFGGKTGGAGDKSFLPIEDRVKIIGA